MTGLLLLLISSTVAVAQNADNAPFTAKGKETSFRMDGRASVTVDFTYGQRGDGSNFRIAVIAAREKAGRLGEAIMDRVVSWTRPHRQTWPNSCCNRHRTAS